MLAMVYNAVPKHIWGVGMQAILVCGMHGFIELLPVCCGTFYIIGMYFWWWTTTPPPPSLPSPWNVLVSLGSCRHVCLFVEVHALILAWGGRTTKLHLCIGLSRYILSMVCSFSKLGPLHRLFIKSVKKTHVYFDLK